MRARHLTIVILAGLMGCQTLGPQSIRVGRARYNDAIQETDKQQMLQNLVRLRYKDFPYFLEVSSVLSAPFFESFVDGSASFGDILDAYNVGGGLRYGETPVIVYAPLGGENFTRRLLKPLDFQTVAMLANAGWESERLYRMCVQSINGVDNAELSAGPTPDRAPDSTLFDRVIANLTAIHDDDIERTGMVTREDEDGNEIGELRMRFDPAAKNRPEVRQLIEDLKLDPGVESYRVTSALVGGGDTIAIVMRPLLGVMYYMAQSVEVPARDAKRGSPPSPWTTAASHSTGSRSPRA